MTVVRVRPQFIKAALVSRALRLVCVFGWLLVRDWLVVAAHGQVSVLHVTKTADTNDGVCDSDCSLREAILMANATPGSDTVIVPASQYNLQLSGSADDQGVTGDLDVTDSLALLGAGAAQTVVDGQGLDRVFDINPTGKAGVAVVLAGLSIQGGVSPIGPELARYPGGGIRSVASLDLSDLIVQNNLAGSGGGIMAALPLTLTRVTVNNNQSVSGGYGGGIYSQAALLVINSVIRQNTTSTSWGAGGIITSGPFTLTTSLILGNDQGGLVTYGPGTISNSTIESNTGASGLVHTGFLTNDTLTINDSTFYGNHAVTNMYVPYRGGAITLRGGQLNLVNTTLSGNHTTGGGGGLMVEGGTATLNNVTIANNVADTDQDGLGDGGGVFALPPVSMSNTLIAGNRDNSPTGNAHMDCAANVNSFGHNLLGVSNGCSLTGDTFTNVLDVDARLETLANNGGSTATHALQFDSPAREAGSPISPGSSTGACAVIDQRGVSRPQEQFCDIGAFEWSRIDLYLPLIYRSANPLPTHVQSLGTDEDIDGSRSSAAIH